MARRPPGMHLPRDVEALIDTWAKKLGIDPSIAKALVWQESRGRQTARSRAGAIGVMQLMPKTAKELKVNPMVLEQNIRGGMTLLARQLKAFKGNYQLALAAYNAGAARVRKAGGIPKIKETQNYVRNILKNSTKFPSRVPGGEPRKRPGPRRPVPTRPPKRPSGGRGHTPGPRSSPHPTRPGRTPSSDHRQSAGGGSSSGSRRGGSPRGSSGRGRPGSTHRSRSGSAKSGGSARGRR